MASDVLERVELEDLPTNDMPPLRHVYAVPEGATPKTGAIALCGYRSTRADASPKAKEYTGKGRHCATCKRIASERYGR